MGSFDGPCSLGIIHRGTRHNHPATRSNHRGDRKNRVYDLSSRPTLLEVDPDRRRSEDAGPHDAGKGSRGDRRPKPVRPEGRGAVKSLMTFAFTPRQMRVSAAAFYCGVSESTFLDRVKSGEYPPGAKDGGARVWLRDDLDAMIERRFGVTNINNGGDVDDPFSARLGS